jgi:hypothetical protein
MTKRLVRTPRAKTRLGVGKTKLYKLAHEGRLALVNIGPGVTGFIEDDEKSPGSIDALIEEMIDAGYKPKVMPERPEKPKAKSSSKKQRAS